LSKLYEYLGIDSDSSATITVTNPNIGSQGVTITGTPTAPWVGAAVAMGLAAFALIYSKKKRKASTRGELKD
jgi:uncharacterized protein (TIGR04145 family)